MKTWILSLKTVWQKLSLVLQSNVKILNETLRYFLQVYQIATWVERQLVKSILEDEGKK